MSHPPDDELLRRAGAGDRAAFQDLLGRHADALFRFAARVTGSGREAEDALQDAMLAAWRGAAGFRGDSPARAWLFQITVNACRRRARRRAGEPDRHEPVEAAAGAEDAAPAPDRHVAARQVGAAIDCALAAMSPEAREVLILRDVEGMDGAEVAQAIQLSVPATKSRLHRARLELKERVEAILGHAITEAMR